MPGSRVALEVGSHSPWMSRHLAKRGHEVVVANPHKVKRIAQARGKATVWTRRSWRDWREWTRSYFRRFGIARSKRKRTSRVGK